MLLRKALTSIALAALGAAAIEDAAAQEPLHVRMSVESAQGAATQTMLAAFRDALAEEMGDAVEIEYFDGGTLGDEIVHMEMVRTGQLDVVPIGSDAVQLDSKWAIFDMPFLFPDRETASRVLDGEIGQELSDSMRESAGLHILGFGEIGFRNITNNVRPVVVPADLQGMKLRVPGSQTRIKAFEMLGAAPVTMNIGELYLALQQGTVDGQENPLANIKAFSWNEVQDYLSLSGHVYTPITLVMNGARWDGLSDDQRAAIERAAAKAVEQSRAFGANADATLLDELSKDMQVNEIDIQAFQEAAKPIWDEIAPVAGEDFTAAVVEQVGS
jgi:tripartite ATP-independent transporter DctP family solute receptor